MSRAIKTLVAALTVIATVTPAAFAHTRSSGTPFVVVVTYGDLDMSAVEGGQTLLQRLKRAAHRVCKEAPSYVLLLLPRTDPSCGRTTVAEIVRQLDIDTLTLAWRGATPSAQLAEQ